MEPLPPPARLIGRSGSPRLNMFVTWITADLFLPSVSTGNTAMIESVLEAATDSLMAAPSARLRKPTFQR